MESKGKEEEDHIEKCEGSADVRKKGEDEDKNSPPSTIYLLDFEYIIAETITKPLYVAAISIRVVDDVIVNNNNSRMQTVNRELVKRTLACQGNPLTNT